MSADIWRFTATTRALSWPRRLMVTGWWGPRRACRWSMPTRNFARPLRAPIITPEQIFYCAESVLLPDYRGQGAGHRFFDLREQHARALGLRFAAFCSVKRPEDHPARPHGYRPLDGFWRKRGYAPLPGVVAQFTWRDLGDATDTAKPLQVWMRAL